MKTGSLCDGRSVEGGQLVIPCKPGQGMEKQGRSLRRIFHTWLDTKVELPKATIFESPF